MRAGYTGLVFLSLSHLARGGSDKIFYTCTPHWSYLLLDKKRAELALIFKLLKMATKCQKDWVSPHKVSLLILVKYISSRSTEEEHEIYADCLTICRDKLSLLLLEFFEVSDFEQGAEVLTI